jgi:hypothetical protein
MSDPERNGDRTPIEVWLPLPFPALWKAGSREWTLERRWPGSRWHRCEEGER